MGDFGLTRAFEGTQGPESKQSDCGFEAALFMPPSLYPKASKMVDEITSCWAMVDFRKCCGLARDMDITVPLYYGSLYQSEVNKLF